MSFNPPALEAAGPQAHGITQHPRVLPWLLAALGFALPFPPAAVSILLAVLIVYAAVHAGQWMRARPWRHPVVATGLLLLAWVAVRTVWTGGIDEPASWHAINKYHELALPLVLLPAFQALRGDGRRAQLFLLGFFAGCTAYAVAHWVALADPTLTQMLEQRRIAAGWMLSVAAFLLLVLPGLPLSRAWRWGGCAFLAATVVVAINGRTGHVAIGVLLPLAALWIAPRRLRLPIAAAMLVAIASVALVSPRFQERLAETAAPEGAVFDGQPLTSTEVRVQLLLNAAELAREYWALGVGPTRYADAHAAASLRRLAAQPKGSAYTGDPWVHGNNPHNEFLMQLVTFGVPGLALFIAWLASSARAARSAGPHRPALLGLVAAYATGCLFNSLLLDFVESHAFVALLSWLLAQQAIAGDAGTGSHGAVT